MRLVYIISISMLSIFTYGEVLFREAGPYCSDKCTSHKLNGVCNDGRPGSASNDCLPGEDCTDCGNWEDEQCTWDLGAVECHYDPICTRQFVLGDFSLDTSCRLDNVGTLSPTEWFLAGTGTVDYSCEQFFKYRSTFYALFGSIFFVIHNLHNSTNRFLFFFFIF